MHCTKNVQLMTFISVFEAKKIGTLHLNATHKKNPVSDKLFPSHKSMHSFPTLLKKINVKAIIAESIQDR